MSHQLACPQFDVSVSESSEGRGHAPPTHSDVSVGRRPTVCRAETETTNQPRRVVSQHAPSGSEAVRERSNHGLATTSMTQMPLVDFKRHRPTTSPSCPAGLVRTSDRREPAPPFCAVCERKESHQTPTERHWSQVTSARCHGPSVPSVSTAVGVRPRSTVSWVSHLPVVGGHSTPHVSAAAGPHGVASSRHLA